MNRQAESNVFTAPSGDTLCLTALLEVGYSQRDQQPKFLQNSLQRGSME